MQINKSLCFFSLRPLVYRKISRTSAIYLPIRPFYTIQSDGTTDTSHVDLRTCWDESCTMGLPEQRQVKVDWYELLCLELL